MGILDCFSSNAPIEFPSDLSVVLSTADNPWVSLVPVIISFLTALVIAIVSLLSSRAVMKSAKEDIRYSRHNEYRKEIQLVMSEVFSSSEPKTFNSNDNRESFVSSASALRFLVFEQPESNDLIQVLDQIEGLGTNQLNDWRATYLTVSQSFLKELER